MMTLHRLRSLALATCLLMACGDDPTTSSDDADVVDVGDVTVGDDADAAATDATDAEVADDADATEVADDTDATEVTDATDATDALQPDRLVGQINVVRFAPEPEFPFAEIFAHAALAPELAGAGIEDAAAWLSIWGYSVYFPDGYDPLPDLGETEVITFDDLWEPASGDLDWLDGGRWITVGDALTLGRLGVLTEEDGAQIFEAEVGDAAVFADLIGADEPMDLAIEGGPDFAGGLAEGAVSMPAPVALDNVDPLQPLPLRAGVPLTLSWPAATPPTDADESIVVRVDTLEATVLSRQADTGGVDLGPLLEGYAFDAAEVDLSIARIREREVQLPDGRVRVVTTARQYLRLESVGAWDVTPDTWPVGTEVTARVRLHDWPLDPAATPIVSVSPVGAAEVTAASIVDTVGAVLSVTLTVPDDAPTGPIALTVAQSGDPAPLVTLPDAAWVAAELPNAGDCDSAVDEGPLADGTYFSSDFGLPTGTFELPPGECVFGEPEGPEQVIPLTLVAGQTLRATLATPRGVGVLYLADACDAPGSARLCYEAAGGGSDAELFYVAREDEEVLLVMDSWVLLGEDDGQRLTISRSEPAPLLVDPDFLTAGLDDVAVVVTSLVGDLDGTETFDLGPAVTVTSASFSTPPDDTVVLTVDLAADAPATLDVTMTRGGDAFTAPDAIDVERLLFAGSCAGADSQPPLRTGSFAGFTTGDGYDPGDDGACQSGLGLGFEGVARVDLGPSERLTVTAWMPDADAVLYLVADGCDAAPMACTDATATGEYEHLTWVAPAGGATVYVFVDAYHVSFGDEFYLDVEIGL